MMDQRFHNTNRAGEYSMQDVSGPLKTLFEVMTESIRAQWNDEYLIQEHPPLIYGFHSYDGTDMPERPGFIMAPGEEFTGKMKDAFAHAARKKLKELECDLVAFIVEAYMAQYSSENHDQEYDLHPPNQRADRVECLHCVFEEKGGLSLSAAYRLGFHRELSDEPQIFITKPKYNEARFMGFFE